MTSTISPQNLRQADLETLATVLNEQHARSIDVVMPADKIKLIGTTVELTGIQVGDGGIDPNGLYNPTNVADEGFADKLEIPISYLRTCRREAPQLYQDNVVTWLERYGQTPEPQPSKRKRKQSNKLLLRLLRSEDSLTGVLRAVLSDSYRTIDNIDVLMAVLAGMGKAGVTDPVIDADLTERRMIVRVVVPQIAVLADKLLENYRSPFDGTDVGRGWTPERVRRISEREGEKIDPRTIFAGFVFTNSEVGSGAFHLYPELTVQVCGNGLRIVAEGTSKRHLGGELEEGIQWSRQTQQANLELITRQAADIVTNCLTQDFVTEQVTKLEEVAGVPVSDAQEVITSVSKKLNFTQAQQSLILSHFIRGGQTTAGGVMQAVTSVAQVERDGDTAFDLEQVAVKAMHLAATEARS